MSTSLDLGTLRLTTAVDLSGIKRGMSSVSSSVRGAGASMKGLTQSTETETKRMGGMWSGMWKGAVLAGGVAALGGVAIELGQLGKSAIEASSDQEQAFGALESVFKKSAGGMKEWAKAQNEIGLSSAEAGNLAVLMGGKFKAVGVSMSESGERAKELTLLGADLAATYGGTTKEAVEALSSTFNGEYDPLERYNAKLSAAAVSARAVEMGLAASTTTVSDAARVQATYALILEKTTDAQGQAARESGTYAGQVGQLKANWFEMKDALGDGLRPAMAKILVSVNEALPKITKQIKAMGPAMKRASGEIAEWLDKAFRGVDVGKSFEQMGAFFEKNGPILADFAKTLSSVFQSIGPMLQDFAKAYASLPDPVKQAMLYAAMGGMIYNKLGQPLVATGGAAIRFGKHLRGGGKAAEGLGTTAVVTGNKSKKLADGLDDAGKKAGKAKSRFGGATKGLKNFTGMAGRAGPIIAALALAFEGLNSVFQDRDVIGTHFDNSGGNILDRAVVAGASFLDGTTGAAAGLENAIAGAFGYTPNLQGTTLMDPFRAEAEATARAAQYERQNSRNKRGGKGDTVINIQNQTLETNNPQDLKRKLKRESARRGIGGS